MEKLKYFLESAYDLLFQSIPSNLEKYKNDDDWISSFFGNDNYYKESSIIVSNLELINGKDSKNDIVNARLVYDTFKDKLTPKQATNVFFWSYLANVKYYNYTKSRWGADSEGTIKDRFFCNTLKGSRTGLFRNSISRLFWYGFLTYQQASNPYILTELLLSNTDLCVSLTERKFGSNQDILLGVLMAIKEINDDLELTKVTMEEWRELAKYLNRYGAVTVLDFLSRDEISNLSKKYILDKRK